MFRNLRNFEPNRARRWANTNRQRLASTGRILAPTLVAFAFATAAHAQGSIDMSGATTLMNTFNTIFTDSKMATEATSQVSGQPQ